jgi:hypothetical protein
MNSGDNRCDIPAELRRIKTTGDFPMNDILPQASTNAPEETEITTEMIAAGVSALPFMAPEAIGRMTEERLVSEVFLAMDRARRESLCRQVRT